MIWTYPTGENYERADKLRFDGPGDVWVFGYGSLMWDPGFPHVDCRPARLHGWHRAFCVHSRSYRGTARNPGLVLGLDRGGSCMGRAYRVAEKDRDRVARYLQDREMPAGEYLCRRVRLHVAPEPVIGYAFVVNHADSNYAGKLSVEEVCARISTCAGRRGPNIEYLRNTVAHLDDLGIADNALHRLLSRVEALCAGKPLPTASEADEDYVTGV